MTPRTGAGRAALLLLLALLSAATWFSWFAWDTTYQTDAAGNPSGPYETWQGLGAAVTMLALTVVGALRIRSWLPVALATTVGFTVAWVVTSASQDETGLWLVGAVLVAVGVFAGTAIVAAITTRVRRGTP